MSAARGEFAEHAYEVASTNRILEAAKFSKGSFYYYFDDKADLAATVLLEVLESSLAVLRAIRLPERADEFWDELRRVQRRSLEVIEASPERYRLLLRLGVAAIKDPRLEALLAPAVVEARALTAALWQRGQALGALRSDMSVPEMVAAVEALKRVAWQTRVPGSQVPTPEVVEALSIHIIEMARRLCAAPVTQ